MGACRTLLAQYALSKLTLFPSFAHSSLPPPPLSAIARRESDFKWSPAISFKVIETDYYSAVNINCDGGLLPCVCLVTSTGRENEREKYWFD